MKNSMKAVIVTPGDPDSVDVRDISLPILSDHELLIRSLYVGIDGTDREINNAKYGESPDGDNYLIIGHEAVGIIIQIGSKVSHFKIGELIVPTVRRPGKCFYCKSGFQDLCLDGDYSERGIKGLHGFMSEYFVEDVKYVVKVPLNLKKVAMLLEPVSIVEKGIRMAWKIQERLPWQPHIALVLGLGSLGILAAIILKNMHLNVYVFSREPNSDPRVQLIKQNGIKYLNSEHVPINKIPSDIGENLDFIFEATGNSSITFKAMSILGKNGVLCLTGVTGGDQTLTICTDCLNLDIVLGNKCIVGCVNANIIDFQTGILHLSQINKNYPNFLNAIITNRISIHDKVQVKNAIRNPEGIKTIIDFEMSEGDFK